MATSIHRLKGTQFFDDNGDPLAGGKVYYYEAGTTNEQTTYSDAAGATPNSNPLTLDAAGRLTASVYFGDSDSFSDYKETLTDSDDVTITNWPIDDLAAASPEESGGNFAAPLLSWTQVVSSASPVALAASDAGKAYEADTTSGNVEFDLPSAASVGDGKGFVFKKTIAANSMIIDQSGSETIDNSATALTVTTQYETIGIFSNGAEWYRVTFFTPDDFVGTSGGVVRSALASVNGLVIVNNSGTPTTSIDVDADDAVLVDTSGTGVRTGAVDVTLDATGTGANGLDTGSLGNDTWYYVWLISNGSTTASLLSTSATSPTMPSGYTYKYRVGAIRTGGSATFLRIKQVGNRAQYVVVSGSTTPNMPFMASGAAGSTTTPTWVAVATGNFVPPTAAQISGLAYMDSSSDSIIVAPNNDYGGIQTPANPPPAGGWSTRTAVPFSFALESSDIYWASSSSDGRLGCTGWVDAVNAN